MVSIEITCLPFGHRCGLLRVLLCLILSAGSGAIAQDSGSRPAGGQSSHRQSEHVGWQSGFGTVLGTLSIYSAVDIGDDIYIGGRFGLIDTIQANNIVRWNRSSKHWDRLATGLNGEVYEMTLVGGDLYVTGDFTMAGSVQVDHIARWNIADARWYPLASGLNGPGFALAFAHGRLYVGGNFTQAGSRTARYLAGWDPVAGEWDTAVTDVSNVVYALEAGGGELFVGGCFDKAGSVPVRNIARWDGSSWHTMAGGTNDCVMALAYVNGSLFVAGNFSLITLSQRNIEARGIARWSADIWSALDGDIQNGATDVEIVDSVVHCLMPGADGSFMILREYSVRTGAVIAERTFPGYAERVLRDGNDLLVMGNFMLQDSERVAVNIARFAGRRIEPVVGVMLRSVSGQVNAIVISGTNLFVGGVFYAAGDSVVYNIARWNTETGRWHPLGGGVNRDVTSMVIQGDSLIVGGMFDSAGGVPVRYVACWDLRRERWFPLDTGIGVVVRGLARDSSGLYAAGYDRVVSALRWQTSPGIVSRWNGRSWVQLGSARFDQGVNAVTVDRGQVYVTGNFRKVGEDTTARFVARWDGSEWHAVGTPIPVTVNYPKVESRAIAVHDGDVYIGGRHFGIFNGIKWTILYRWRATVGEWELLDSTGFLEVSALVSTPAGLYVAGEFDSLAQATSLSSVARIDPYGVSRFSHGISQFAYVNNVPGRYPGSVKCLAVDGPDLYFGGLFDRADDIPSINLAHWSEPARAVNISVEPRTLDFGYVSVGQSLDRTFAIVNDSSSTTFLHGAVDTLAGEMLVIAGGGEYALAPGAARVVTVRYQPTQTGNVSRVLSVGHNATNEVEIAVRLVGRSGVTGAGSREETANTTMLACAPNPVAGRTRIRYTVTRPEVLRLTIVDPLGRTVTTLVDGFMEAGAHDLEWDSASLSGGAYLIVLECDGLRRTAPIVVAR